ncbi:MAG: cytochrome c3 family protein [Nitrospinae bacterium]|nr:cytochrome c3 family protein [Nitrospinota bacterium]
MKEKFENDLMLNTMMGVSMCYACHGKRATNEGVNCETCHGTTLPGKSIEETHAKKYEPGLADLKKPDFCPKCHEMNNPISGSAIMSVYSEWRKSDAGKKGITCQECHMGKSGNGLSYHGFDSGVRDIGIYKDDLAVKEIKLDFPRISLLLENRVTGHAIPASCGTRLLVMELSFRDVNGKEIYTLAETFTKKTELMANLMPYKVLKNSQLQSGEKRRLVFQLPLTLRGQVSEVIITLRFYEVPDEYSGDLKWANWASEPILRQTARF